MEVFHNGTWGTICQSHWNVNDGNVVCRELGFARSLSFPGFSTFAGGTGQVRGGQGGGSEGGGGGSEGGSEGGREGEREGGREGEEWGRRGGERG